MDYATGEGPLSLIVIEEVALEGLEGLSIDGLWKRLSPVLGIDLPFLENFQNQIWNFIKKSQSLLQFYELPEPREKLKIFRRFDFTDSELGEFSLPDECPFTRYKYNPIEDGEIRGSCEFYRERKLISYEEIKDMSLDEALGRWGDKFVIVAFQHIREHFLIPETAHIPKDLTVQQYSILEIIGRSRHNGEVTCGKHSLLYIFKDSNLLFYVKNKLLEHKFITRELYYERTNNRTHSGQLLTLPKFFSEIKSKSMFVIEELFKLIKAKENGFIPTEEARVYFKSENIVPSLKKIKLHAAFKKCFQIAKVPYRLLHPYSDETEYMQKNREKEKIILCWQLKDPDMKFEDIWMDDEPGDDGEMEFSTYKEYCLDTPILNQVFKYIDENPQGVKQSQIIKEFGFNRYMIRAVLRKLVDGGTLKIFMEDFGRQKTSVFISQRYAKLKTEMLLQQEKQSSKSVSKLNETTELSPNDVVENAYSENLENDVEDDLDSSILTSREAPESIGDDGDLLLIEATIKDLPDSLYKVGSLWAKKLTEKQIKRKNIIISVITQKKLVDLTNLSRIIKEAEVKSGYREEVCRKSVQRLLSYLISEKMFKGYEIILTKGSYARVLKYFTVPEILTTDEIFQDELKKCKTAMHLAILDKTHKQRILAKQILEPEKNEGGNTGKISAISRDVPKTPKFLRAQYYHEFFFFLAYEQKRNIKPIAVTENIIQNWKEYDPTLDIDELLPELPKLYSESISWKMFVPPLPENWDTPLGWMSFNDVISRLPLSLITKTNWIKRSADNILDKYLSHPIRQHYLIHSIPDVATYLFENNVNFNQIDDVIKLLGNMGLIQVMEKIFKELRKSWFYVNRHAKLLDTCTSDPGYNKISNYKEYPEQLYYFSIAQNVSDYWRNLHKIVLTTKLGFKKHHGNQMVTIIRKTLNEIEPVTFAEAPKKDIGYIPGDHLGAGGLDTRLYSHLNRNWSWQVENKRGYPRRTGKSSLESLGKIKKVTRKDVAQKKKVKLTLIAGKRITLKRHVASTSKRDQKIRKDYDDIDKEALKRMKSLRVTWTPEEDRLLKICRSVFLYLNDPFAIRSIQFSTVRDILQWAIASLNKTARACHRRLLFMTKYKRDLPDTAAWLHDLKQNQYITKLYGPTFLKDLKKVYPIDREYSAALKIHYIKLVSYLIKILNQSKFSTQNEIILPDTLNQFNMLYNCCSSSVHDKQLKHYEPTTYEDIEVSTINGLIHSSVCCTKDKTLYNIQLFEIYKEYNETILAKAFTKVRRDYLVVATKSKDAPTCSQKLLPVGPTLVLSVKYRQQLFIRVPYSCIDELHQAYETYLLRHFANNETYDYTSVDAGTSLFLNEMYTRGDNSVDIQLPQRILTVDPHQEKCKVSEKILEHFRRLFENAPKTEYSKRFEEKFKNSGGSQTKIRFNVINESCKIPYNPFDILAKLSDDYIHFFCALNSLNKEVSLDFTQLTESNFCPLDCVLKDQNYITSVEKIIMEKRRFIEGLKENHDFDEEMEEKVLITEENIIQLFMKLFNTLRARSKVLQQKDMGKTSFQPQAVNVLLLAKEILDYSDQDFISIDGEYMPTLSKEDKIIKAQDIFVVNLPKIKVNHVNDGRERVKYKDMLVPDTLTNSGYDKEEVINKIMREYILNAQSSTVDKLMEDMTMENFSNTEQSFTKDVLKYMESHKLGVSSENLLKKFGNEKMLGKSISILRKHSLVMRVGVEYFTYVHKSHIQPWVVNTYHIKRLEKESLKPSEYLEMSSKPETMESANNDEPTSKKIKLQPDLVKSTEKNTTPDKSATTKSVHKQREKIIMRPCPWMRVNGSLNRRVLDKWIGTILLECVTLNGLDVLSLCIRFNMLHPVNILFLLEILQDIGCIHLKSKSVTKATLLSAYQDPIIGDANEFTKKEDMFVVLTPNALTNLSLFIGDKKYKTDFV